MGYTLGGKTIIISGANSGIGKAATVQLVALGATVVMACRSVERGMRAFQDVKRETGKDNIEMMCVDMSSHIAG